MEGQVPATDRRLIGCPGASLQQGFPCEREPLLHFWRGMLKVVMKGIFFPNREVQIIQLANLTLLALVSVLFAIDTTSGVHMAALVGTTIFALTMIPARLLGLKWPKSIDADLLKLAYQGKWLGIWTCVWFVMYASFALVDYYGVPFYVSQFVQRETILLSASLFIFTVLLTLSNKWSYAHVRWWKQINMFIWLTVPFLFTHFLLAANIFGSVGYFWAPWTLLVLVALAGVSGIFRAKRDYFAWWRIWLLLTGALVSALVVFFYPAIL